MVEFCPKELPQKIIRGQDEPVRKGLFQGGAVPIVYQVVDRKLAIDEEAARIVREAFELYAEGGLLTISATFSTARGTGRLAKVNLQSKASTQCFKTKNGLIYEFWDFRVEDAFPVLSTPICSNVLKESCRITVIPPPVVRPK